MIDIPVIQQLTPVNVDRPWQHLEVSVHCSPCHVESWHYLQRRRHHHPLPCSAHACNMHHHMLHNNNNNNNHECRHTQYAVLEANAKVNRKSENLHPRLSQTPVANWMPLQIYHYIQPGIQCAEFQSIQLLRLCSCVKKNPFR